MLIKLESAIELNRTWEQDFPLEIDNFVGEMGVAVEDIDGLADGGDLVAGDGEGSIEEDPGIGIDGDDDGAVKDDEG